MFFNSKGYMSKLQNNAEISNIHAMLDELPNAEQIQDSIVNELLTVQDVVRYLVSCFSSHSIFVGHGTDNYWDEALEIVQAVMHLQPQDCSAENFRENSYSIPYS